MRLIPAAWAQATKSVLPASWCIMNVSDTIIIQRIAATWKIADENFSSACTLRISTLHRSYPLLGWCPTCDLKMMMFRPFRKRIEFIDMVASIAAECRKASAVAATRISKKAEIAGNPLYLQYERTILAGCRSSPQMIWTGKGACNQCLSTLTNAEGLIEHTFIWFESRNKREVITISWQISRQNPFSYVLKSARWCANKMDRVPVSNPEMDASINKYVRLDGILGRGWVHLWDCWYSLRLNAMIYSLMCSWK